jgi:hypothetical protein
VTHLVLDQAVLLVLLLLNPTANVLMELPNFLVVNVDVYPLLLVLLLSWFGTKS